MKERKVISVVFFYIMTLGFYNNWFLSSVCADLNRGEAQDKVSIGKVWLLLNTISVFVYAAMCTAILAEALSYGLDLTSLEKALQLIYLALTLSVSFKIRNVLNLRFGSSRTGVWVGRFRTLFFQCFYIQFCINKIMSHQAAREPNENRGSADLTE